MATFKLPSNSLPHSIITHYQPINILLICYSYAQNLVAKQHQIQYLCHIPALQLISCIIYRKSKATSISHPAIHYPV